MTKPRSALGAVALTLVLILTACGTSDTAPAGERTTSAAPTRPASTTAAPSPGELAASQLQKYLAVRDLAYSQRDINFATLNPVATGDEFLALQKAVVDLRKANVTKAGRYVHTLGAPRDRGASVEITDCENRSGVTVKVNGGPHPGLPRA